MSDRPTLSWVVSLLLSTILAVIATALTVGWLNRMFGPDLAPAAGVVAAAGLLPGFPEPLADLPPERFFERVDGAADALIAAGCVRLVHWHLPDLPADLELLVFRDEAGAAQVLGREIGPERTPGPGDEASVAPGSVYFRRGRIYVRLLAEAGQEPAGGRLAELAQRADAALASPASSAGAVR